MEQIKSTLHNSTYSKLNNKNNSTYSMYSKDKGDILRIFNNLNDVLNESYYPFYSNKIRELGTERFLELANKARTTSDTPHKLFCWMLKNNELVR